MTPRLLVLLFALWIPATALADGGVSMPPDASVPSGDAGLPGSGLVVEPTFLSFGQVAPSSPTVRTFTLRNTETVATITVSGFNKPSTLGCAGFSVSAPRPLPILMTPQQIDTWSVGFSSSTPGSYGCRVDILDTDGNPDFIDLSAVVAVPVMSVAPLALELGDVLVGSSGWDGFYISNTGAAPLTITGVTRSGSADFMVMTLGTPFQVPAMSSTFVNVMYTPGGAGADSGTVVITGNDPQNPSDTVTLSGNGVTIATGPHLTLSPNPLNFGSVAVTGNVDRTLSIGNDGGQTASITRIELTGPDASAYTIESFGCTGVQSCPVTLSVTAGGPPAAATVRCRPLSTGSKVASVTVTSNASNTPTSAALTCTGTGPVVSLDRTAVDFGTIRVGTPATLQLTVRNLGNVDLAYTLARSGAAAADHAVSPSCSSTCTLGAGASQVHALTFTPSALGNRNITLTVTSNDPLAPTRDVTIAGVGGGGVLTLVTPGSGTLPFGDLPVATTSSPQPVRIRNDGNLDLRVGSIALGSATAFGLAGTTPPPDVVLAPGVTHAVDVTCTPPQAMTYGAVLTVQSDAPVGATRTVTLSCRGVVSDLLATPAPVSFEPTRVGDARVVTMTVRNTGGAAITIDALTTSPGVFAVEGEATLPHPLPGGGSFFVDLLFTPTTDGDVTGELVIAPASGTPRAVALFGPGRIASFTLTPELADFGTVCAGSTTVQRFTLASTGSADLEVARPTLTDPDRAFDLILIAPDATAYPLTLAPTSTATMDVAAAPTAGSATGTLTISTDVDDGERTVALSIEAIDHGVALSPGALDFGAVPVDQLSTAREVALANCDPAPLGLTAVRITGDDNDAFAVGGTLPPPTLTVPVEGSVRWTVVFAPRRAGAHDAMLEIEHAGGTAMIPLTGFGGTIGPDAGPGGDAGLGTTSYYACWCRAPAGEPGGAAPVLLALAFLLWPRRPRR